MSKADTFVNKFADVYGQNQSNIAGLYVEDPTVLGFTVWFHFPYVPARSYQDYSPLFSEQPGSDSAVLYLESIGEATRANSLRDFNKRLNLLINDTPHYFQTLDGLSGVNKFDPATPLRAFDRKISINTLESLDLRVSTMVGRYMEAVYDFEFHRQIVPQNLLNFTCIVQIIEIRNFRRVINARAADDAGRFKLLNQDLGVHNYVLEMCNFDFTDSLPWLDSLDNKGGEFAAGKLTFSVGKISEAHKLTFLEIASGSAPVNAFGKESPLPLTSPRDTNVNPDALNPQTIGLGSVNVPGGFPISILDRAKLTAKFVETEILAKGQLLQQKLNLRTLALRGLNDLFDQLDSRIKGFILGNVFSDLNRFFQNDFYTTVKDFIKNVIDGKPVQIAATTAFGNNVPDHIQTKIDELGKVALAYVKQNEVQLGNIPGFDQDPLKALETAILAGSLGNVFKGG